ncbi:lactate utilization protein [Lachnoclostridium sp.]|uniref:lactate utilization protein n=1 Tax=Lachnoclostridium sp. TaxID=2028282 RepID=UPI00289F25F2|nr:lactate utilization protein [Lachnoclostridium sp.]
MSSPKKQYYENLADSLIEKFNQRGIEGYYCDNKEEALTVAKRFLTPGCSVSWGGSMTLDEIGLLDEFHNSDYIIYDRNKAKTPEERSELYGKIVTADYYFMSSNAITLDGKLVNIDGNGNRVACLITGPKNVIVIAGMNKIATDEAAAMERVRNMAAPPNAIRLNRKTPCAELGRCANCLVPDCICSSLVITRRSHVPYRLKVILVGEELGY